MIWRSGHGGELEECCVVEAGVYLLHLFFCYGKKRSPVLVVALIQPSHAVSAWCWGSPAVPVEVCRLRRRADELCCKVTVSPSPALAHSLAAHLGHTMPLPPLHPFHPSVTAHPCWLLTCPMYWERGPLVPQQGDGWFPALKNTSGVAPCGHCCSLRKSGSCGMRC